MGIRITCEGLKEQMLKAKSNGQDYKYIAKCAEVHPVRLSSIINDKREPSKAEMIKLCSVFNKPLEEMFEFEIFNSKKE